VVLRPGILLLALLAWPGAILHAQPAAALTAHAPVTASPPAQIHEYVDVGGYKLYISCVGAGEPTIVFDNAGYLDLWHLVQARSGGYRRACSYDREGLGLSDPGPGEITTGRLVRDLHRLLVRGHIPGPYLLVGDAFGGTTAFVYASRYHRQVIGVVLADAIPGDLLSRFTVIPGGETNFGASVLQVRRVTSLGVLPLVVVSHQAGSLLPQRVEGQWRRTQRVLAGLSSNSVYVVGEHSGYAAIPSEQPALLFTAISQVLVALRNPAHTLAPCNVFYQRTGGRCMSSSGT
jgi:pimeloyl-ACP methyl ester carboxylesterase